MPRAQKVNSRIENLSKFAKEMVEELDTEELLDFEDEGYVPSRELASFIDYNWKEITGLNNRAKDEESYFPSEVEGICIELGVDMDDFSDAWGMQREGSEDWEEDPRECAECGEEIEDDRDWDDEDLCSSCAIKQEELEDE